MFDTLRYSDFRIFSRDSQFASWKRLHWCISKVNSAHEIASLMAMFSLIAAVELPLSQDGQDAYLIIAFVSTTSLLVATTVIVKVVSTYFLPHLDVTAELSVREAASGPHDTIVNWIVCTCMLGHTLAPVLFCLDLILISWIKFPKYAKEASMAVTAIITPMIIVILIVGSILYQQMQLFKATKPHSHADRRYSEIAESWDALSDHGSLSQVLVSGDDEESQLLASNTSVTSYGAIVQNEYIGSPNSVFADVC